MGNRSKAKDGYISVNLADIRKEMQCPICLGIIHETRAVMECLHRFCKECIDKSMRLGNNECPACRTHCASRRSLRDDPKFDSLIAVIYPNLDKYEAEEFTMHADESWRNRKIQMKIRAIEKKQQLATSRRRVPNADEGNVHARKGRPGGRGRRLEHSNEEEMEEEGEGDEEEEEAEEAEEVWQEPVEPERKATSPGTGRGSRLRRPKTLDPGFVTEAVPFSSDDDREEDLPGQADKESSEDAMDEELFSAREDGDGEEKVETGAGGESPAEARGEARWKVTAGSKRKAQITRRNGQGQHSHNPLGRLKAGARSKGGRKNRRKGGALPVSKISGRGRRLKQEGSSRKALTKEPAASVEMQPRVTALLKALENELEVEVDMDLNLDVHLQLRPLDDTKEGMQKLPDLEMPHLCCSPAMTVLHLSKFLGSRLLDSPDAAICLSLANMPGPDGVEGGTKSTPPLGDGDMTILPPETALGTIVDTMPGSMRNLVLYYHALEA